MRILVVYNPQAGNGRARNLLPQIENYLIEHDINADFQLTSHSGHATSIVAAAPIHEFDAVIASGGDGTLFEVLNGYYQNPQQEKPPLGLIPNGTGNAFMKELKITSTDWRRAVDIIAKGQTRHLDVGQFKTSGQEYYFLNMVGMGFVTEVAKAAVPLKWLGNAAYTLATLTKVIRLKPQKINLKVDGQDSQHSGIFVEVANSTFTGTHFLMAPKAKLDDGLLDIVLLKKISRLRLLRLFTSIYDGSHINYPEIEYIQGTQISIVEERPGELIPDGEVLGKTPVTFKCLPRDIAFLWGNYL